MFQDKLDHYQKQYNERLEEEKIIERETKEQMISKITAFILDQILKKLN